MLANLRIDDPQMQRASRFEQLSTRVLASSGDNVHQSQSTVVRASTPSAKAESKSRGIGGMDVPGSRVDPLVIPIEVKQDNGNSDNDCKWSRAQECAGPPDGTHIVSLWREGEIRSGSNLLQSVLVSRPKRFPEYADIAAVNSHSYPRRWIE